MDKVHRFAEKVADRLVVGLLGHRQYDASIASHRDTFRRAYLAVLGPHPEVRRSLYLSIAESKGKSDYLKDVERAISLNNEWLPQTFEGILRLEFEMMVTAIINNGPTEAKQGLTRLSA